MLRILVDSSGSSVMLSRWAGRGEFRPVPPDCVGDVRAFVPDGAVGAADVREEAFERLGVDLVREEWCLVGRDAGFFEEAAGFRSVARAVGRGCSRPLG